MSALASIAEPRAVPFSPTTFYAYRVTENGRTYPLIVSCSTLREAIDGAKVQCFHKEHLLIREVEGGRTMMRLFAIRRKSTPRYVHRDHVTRAVHDLYADPVCVIDGSMFG